MAGFLGGVVKQKSDSGRGQACIKFQHDGGLPNLLYLLGISESPITTLSDPRGHHAFTRALLLAGLELPCDAGRLQSRSSTKRGERRGGIASGPEAGAGLFLVGGESAAGRVGKYSRFSRVLCIVLYLYLFCIIQVCIFPPPQEDWRLINGLLTDYCHASRHGLRHTGRRRRRASPWRLRC